jgi:5-methylcytosine-specific restriction endonuclease McrBC regulatory subunit McrC
MTNIGRKVQATNKFIMMMFPFSTFYSICKIIDENSVMNYNNNKNASVCLLFITERIFENRICPKLGFTR